jgi:hypothetical protein
MRVFIDLKRKKQTANGAGVGLMCRGFGTLKSLSFQWAGCQQKTAKSTRAVFMLCVANTRVLLYNTKECTQNQKHIGSIAVWMQEITGAQKHL